LISIAGLVIDDKQKSYLIDNFQNAKDHQVQEAYVLALQGHVLNLDY
jgi:hypothetical protein